MAPLPVIVSLPSLSSVQVRLSPQVPLSIVSATASGAAVNSISTTKKIDTMRFPVFMFRSPSAFEKSVIFILQHPLLKSKGFKIKSAGPPHPALRAYGTVPFSPAGSVVASALRAEVATGNPQPPRQRGGQGIYSPSRRLTRLCAPRLPRHCTLQTAHCKLKNAPQGVFYQSLV